MTLEYSEHNNTAMSLENQIEWRIALIHVGIGVCLQTPPSSV